MPSVAVIVTQFFSNQTKQISENIVLRYSRAVTSHVSTFPLSSSETKTVLNFH